MNAQRLLSIVVPVYNEASNIRAFYDRLMPVVEEAKLRVEVIFTDDGSTDGSFDVIRSLANEDDRIKCLRFSRNFGSHAAIMAGLRFATGDGAVMIAVDLQDPPELIPELVSRWNEGHHVVWAVREGRDDPFLKRLFAAAFYAIFRRIALPEYPATGMDFGLFDRRVLESLRRFTELNHFITGMIVWLGFEQARVTYHRRARHSGSSKWSLGKRIKNALDAIVSFSYVPVRAISYLGLLISLASFVFAAFLVIRTLLFGLGSPGWPSVMVTVLFMGGVQLLVLGILGEYIWRGTEQARARPQYVLRDAIGFELQPGASPCGELRATVTS